MEENNETELTAKQLSGIEALLTTSSVKDAAKKAKVSLATMHRWMSLDEFLATYRTYKSRLVTQAMTRIQSATSKAVDSLIEIVESKKTSPQTRLTACKAILNFSLKAVENEQILARLEALEKATRRRPKM